MAKLGFVSQLEALGLNGASRAAVIGNVIGRMAKPGSELATWKWQDLAAYDAGSHSSAGHAGV
jgi:hypothetical protein